MERFDWLEVDKAKPKPDSPPGETFDGRHYLDKAEAAYRRGNYEFALRHYGKALNEDPNTPEAWTGQVLCLAELGEFDEAKLWANKALDRFPQCADLLAVKALVAAKLGDSQDAMTLSDRAIAKKDAAGRVWLLRGLTLLCLGPSGNHEGCFIKAKEEGSRDGYAELRIGMGYLEKGDAPHAKEMLERAAEMDSENPLAWRRLGECCERLFAYGRAQVCYGRALALDTEAKDDLLAAVSRLQNRGFGDWLASLFKRNHGA